MDKIKLKLSEEQVATSMRLIEGFKAYNESLFWQISKEYYQNKGISAWSESCGKKIPHEVTSNYQNAKAFAELIKANLKKYPKNHKLKILECGAGSGRFSRNFLYAAKEIKILDRIEFWISDFAIKNLQEIKSRKILGEFKEGEDYHFVVLDILKIDQAKDLSGKKIKIENFSAIILNYVLDALKLTIIKKLSPKSFEELQIRLHLRQDIEEDVLNNLFYHARIQKSYKWAPYDFKKESTLEKKYSKVLLDYYQDINKDIYFIYEALAACDGLTKILDDSGFILSEDIIPEQNEKSLVVGNAIAHEIDNNFIAHYFKKQKMHCKVITDKLISRLLIAKTPILEKVLDDLFVSDSQINRYIELQKIAKEFNSKETADCFKHILEQIDEITIANTSNLLLWSKYFQLIGNKKKSQEILTIANEIDFWNDLPT